MIINGKPWVAMFSQSGAEIADICKTMDIRPEFIITNNFDKESISKDLLELDIPILHLKPADINESLRSLDEEEYFITLHGYLRIIPEDICDKHEVYNGHPAPVHLYPELKGKDKQEDLFTHKDKYPQIGCIIHRVTPELDNGEILESITRPNNIDSIQEAYRIQKAYSLITWINFFNKRI